MFHKAIEMNPTYTEAYFNPIYINITCNISILLLHCHHRYVAVSDGKLEESEKYLKQSLQLNPQHHGALNNLKVIEFQKRKAQRRKTYLYS